MAAATVRRPLYKDVLQPALHRRFSTTLGLLVIVTFFETVILGRWDSVIWSWFPVGPAGGRSLLLLPISFAITTLRIAQYHVGVRTSDSGLSTFLRYFFQLQTLEAIVTYSFCAYYFSQFYLWSLPEGSGLEWITYFMSDRARLNEKALYFTSNLVVLGLYQALLHLHADKDRLQLGAAKAQEKAEHGSNGDTHWKRLWERVPTIVTSSFNQAAIGCAISLFAYPIFIRATLWRTMLFFLRPVYNLPRTNMLPASLPFSAATLTRCFFASFLLMLLLTTANVAFSLFLAREPLKNGKPLSSDSKDPNGSLLNGLKSKKDSIRCFAMWELAVISRDFEPRRKTIYEDIDRKDGPMWSQIYGICIEVVKSLEARVDAFIEPLKPKIPELYEKVESKKRTVPVPKSEDAIFHPTPQKPKFVSAVEKAVTNVATSPGQGSQLSPTAKKVYETGRQQLLRAQQGLTGSGDPQSIFKSVALKVITSSFGWPFRQEYRRRVASVVLGGPYGEPSLYINAASALSLLAEHSLVEDKYGNVQRDVAAIIRTLTTVVKKLHDFKEGLVPHWTDVNNVRQCPEVEEISEVLKDALARLITEFGPYARDLRLSLTDMRLAREAMALGGDDQREEMRQVR